MDSGDNDDKLSRTSSVTVASLRNWNFALKLKHPKVEFVALHVGCEVVYSPVSNHRTEPKSVIRINKGESMYEELKVIHRKLTGISPGRWMGLAPILNDDREIIGFRIETKFKEKHQLIPGARYRFGFRSVKVINREIVFDLKIPDTYDYVDDKEPLARPSLNEHVDPPGAFDDIKKAKEATSTWIKDVTERSAWDDENDKSSDTLSWVKDLPERPAWEDPNVWHSLRDAAKFTGVAILCIIELLSKLLWYTAEFILKMVQLLTHLLTVMTPIIIRFIDFLTSSVGGLYWMLYMIWRSIVDPRPLNNRPPIDNTFIQPSLQYKPTITPYRKLAIMPRQSPTGIEYYGDFSTRNIPELTRQLPRGAVNRYQDFNSSSNFRPSQNTMHQTSNNLGSFDPNKGSSIEARKLRAAKELEKMKKSREQHDKELKSKKGERAKKVQFGRQP